MSLGGVFHHHNSACYVYQRVEPVLDDIDTEGGLMVVTDRDPNEAWLAYVDQVRAHRPLAQIGGILDDPPTLGVADLVYVLHGRWPERVTVFPRYSF